MVKKVKKKNNNVLRGSKKKEKTKIKHIKHGKFK